MDVCHILRDQGDGDPSDDPGATACSLWKTVKYLRAYQTLPMGRDVLPRYYRLVKAKCQTVTLIKISICRLEVTDALVTSLRDYLTSDVTRHLPFVRFCHGY